MRIPILISCLLLFFSVPLLRGQQGTVRGTIFDAANGESLPGVAIFIEGTTIGTTTDLDGKFNLMTEPGTFSLNISYISFETTIIQNVKIKPGDVTLLGDIMLKEQTFELSEVTITAQAVRNTETALFTMKKKSANLMDGISAANFRKIGDSDAAATMKRVTGVSVADGKYVYVRGLGDRYTKTILNGMDIPGLDPDRNTLQMDIFPTSVIDNIIVYKSFSADLPADFTGGVVDITTVDFPEEESGKISASIGFNPSMHFNSNYLTYDGGKTDFLGFDDGTRTIPAKSNIPQYVDAISDIDGPAGTRYRSILEDFNPTLAANSKTSFMDFSLGVSYGNQKKKEKFTLGYNFVISYKNESEYFENAEFGRYGLAGDPDIYEMEVREYQLGNIGKNYVLLSGLAGIAIKTESSKYRINVLHLQNGESTAAVFDYQNSDQGADFYGFQHNLEYNQRSLSNLLLAGDHIFIAKDWKLEWKLAPSYSVINDPDIRFTRYENRDGNWSIGTEVGFPERIWRNLEELNMSGVVNATKGFQLMGEDAKLLFGGAYTYKERDYMIRNYAFNIRDIPLTGNPDELFYQENLWPYNGDPGRGTTYEAHFIPDNPNQYNSSVGSSAAYVATELRFFNRLKANLGLRVENYQQRYTGEDQQSKNVLDNEVVMDQTSLFPSINIIYQLGREQNLRASYSRTIARPSFKELSYAEIYDPITGRTFIGGLFRDADDQAGIEYWDGDLQSTDIYNYDLRWEMYRQGGQMFSVSGFYKYFIKPIEIVQYATQPGAFQPRNVGNGQVYGIEAEARFNLETITEKLKSFGILLNFTYAASRIELSDTEYESRKQTARSGEIIDDYRPMAGQAPYLFNAGLTYEGGEKGFWRAFEAGLYYNVQGETLEFVGIADRPDIIAEPFNSLNFNANKRFGEEDRMQIALRVENILNDRDESVFRSYQATDQYFERLSPGIHFKLSYSYRL